jgi:hypothetical protein
MGVEGYLNTFLEVAVWFTYCIITLHTLDLCEPISHLPEATFLHRRSEAVRDSQRYKESPERFVLCVSWPGNSFIFLWQSGTLVLTLVRRFLRLTMYVRTPYKGST